ncbi:MAG: hypothetical protein COV48_11755, partial [Elusimicrobia bacterium CG11_big_fil_rev_8_21_14_0_20_64_6]
EGFTKAELIAKIREGVAQSQKADASGPAPLIRMPAWDNTLDDGELDAVAAYLLSLMSPKDEDSDSSF